MAPDAYYAREKEVAEERRGHDDTVSELTISVPRESLHHSSSSGGKHTDTDNDNESRRSKSTSSPSKSPIAELDDQMAFYERVKDSFYYELDRSLLAAANSTTDGSSSSSKNALGTEQPLDPHVHHEANVNMMMTTQIGSAGGNHPVANQLLSPLSNTPPRRRSTSSEMKYLDMLNGSSSSSSNSSIGSNQQHSQAKQRFRSPSPQISLDFAGIGDLFAPAGSSSGEQQQQQRHVDVPLIAIDADHETANSDNNNKEEEDDEPIQASIDAVIELVQAAQIIKPTENKHEESAVDLSTSLSLIDQG